MGETPKPSSLWFRDFWTRHQAPKQIVFIFGESKTPKQHQDKYPKLFNNSFVIDLKTLEIQHFDMFGKDGRRTIPKIRLIKSSKILDMGQISSWKTWNDFRNI